MNLIVAVLNIFAENPLPLCFIVTGLVDRIKFNRFEQLPIDRDIKLTGCVTWVGKSSMEVSIQLQQAVYRPDLQKSLPSLQSARTDAQLTSMYPPPDSFLTPYYPNSRPVVALPPPGAQWRPVLEAHFLLMARSAQDLSAFHVSELETPTALERQVFEDGAERTQMRKRFLDTSLSAPTGAEIEEVHRLFLADLHNRPFSRLGVDARRAQQLQRISGEDGAAAATIGETRMQSSFACHPEERNLFNRMFGGFIMLKAAELAAACATAHCQRHVRLLAIDHFRFLRPVEIGTLLVLDAHVVYVTEAEAANELHLTVCVNADSVNLPRGLRAAAAVQQGALVFAVDSAVAEKPPASASLSRIRRVHPDSYESAVMYLLGRRHYLQILDELQEPTLQMEMLTRD